MVKKFFISSIQKIIHKSIHEPDFMNLVPYINNEVPLDTYFLVLEINKDQVFSMLRALNIKKSTRLDLLVGPRILKISAECICSKPLTKIIMYYIVNGIFPERCEEAKFIPMHKTGPIDDISCYRPVLPTLSKIIEKHIFISFYEYLDKYSLILRNKPRFRRSHSCETSLLQYWYDNVNKGKIVGTVFIDLRKAFDLVDHKLILLKLRL